MKITLLFIAATIYSFVVFGQQIAVQKKIEDSFNSSFATQQNLLEPIIEELKQDTEANSYWIAYAQMHSAIYSLQTRKTDQAAAAIADGIHMLENVKSKTSEDLALLGYLTSFSISFDPASAARLSGKAQNLYEQALKKDDRNLRVYLGLGESDFHKPAEYGGGKKVEEYLLKAISLSEQSVQNGPTWGKNSAYYTLASFYLREGDKDKAKLFCMQGLNKYPNDYRLNQLKSSLQ